MLKMDVFINLFLLFHVHILLEKLFMNVVKTENCLLRTHVAFKEPLISRFLTRQLSVTTGRNE